MAEPLERVVPVVDGTPAMLSLPVQVEASMVCTVFGRWENGAFHIERHTLRLVPDHVELAEPLPEQMCRYLSELEAAPAATALVSKQELPVDRVVSHWGRGAVSVYPLRRSAE